MKDFIGKRIVNLRMQNKMSLEELCYKTEIPFSYLSKIERGIVYPSLKNIEKICEVFKISISLFFDARIHYPIKFQELLNLLDNCEIKELEKTINFIIAFSKKE